MSSKGGRTSTTWNSGSSWRHDETKVIRVPVALADEIMNYAKALDQGKALLHGNSVDNALNAIAAYIGYKRSTYHPNQHSKQLDTKSRGWDELRRLTKLLLTDPQKLELTNDNDAQQILKQEFDFDLKSSAGLVAKRSPQQPEG